MKTSFFLSLLFFDDLLTDLKRLVAVTALLGLRVRRRRLLRGCVAAVRRRLIFVLARNVGVVVRVGGRVPTRRGRLRACLRIVVVVAPLLALAGILLDDRLRNNHLRRAAAHAAEREGHNRDG